MKEKDSCSIFLILTMISLRNVYSNNKPREIAIKNIEELYRALKNCTLDSGVGLFEVSKKHIVIIYGSLKTVLKIYEDKRDR